VPRGCCAWQTHCERRCPPLLSDCGLRHSKIAKTHSKGVPRAPFVGLRVADRLLTAPPVLGPHSRNHATALITYSVRREWKTSKACCAPGTPHRPPGTGDRRQGTTKCCAILHEGERIVRAVNDEERGASACTRSMGRPSPVLTPLSGDDFMTYFSKTGAMDCCRQVIPVEEVVHAGRTGRRLKRTYPRPRIPAVKPVVRR